MAREDDDPPVTEEREKELFARLEKHVEAQDTGWHAHSLHRAAEFRARMIDQGHPLLVQLIAVHTLREELRMKLHDIKGSVLPDGGDYVTVKEMMEVCEGVGGAMAYLHAQLKKEGKA